MKVLFLDIDGVLNTMAELGYSHVKGYKRKRLSPRDWDPNSLYNLYRIVEQTGCKIVVSSVWRLGESLDSMKSWFKECPLLRDAVIGKTPSIYRDRECVQRGEEIRCWIEANRQELGITRIAILDDDSDMEVVKQNFFQTNSYDGLNWDTASKVIEHLNYQEIHDWASVNELCLRIRDHFGKDPDLAEHVICELINAHEGR